MKNSCPQRDSNPGPSAYEASALSVELLELINTDHLKVTAFDLTSYITYLYHVFTFTPVYMSIKSYLYNLVKVVKGHSLTTLTFQ